MASKVEVKTEIKDPEFHARLQTATQDYNCNECKELIPDETKYVRTLWDPKYRSNGMLARHQTGEVEVYHVACWNGDDEDGTGQDSFLV